MLTRYTGVALFLLGLVFAVAAPARADGPKKTYTIKWLIGHPTTDYFEEAARHFKEKVEAGSRGAVKVEIVTQEDNWEDEGRATPGPEIAAKVRKGEAQMGHSFTDVMGDMDPRLLAFNLPFVFKDYRHLEKVIEGPSGQELLAGLETHGLKGLAFTFSGGANIISGNRPIREPADLKGLRVATYGDAVGDAWLRSLGAVPVTVKHREDRAGELFAKGKVDAAVLTWRRQYVAKPGGGLFPYGSLEGSTYLVSVTYINKAFFDGLPSEYRALISEVAREAGRIERADTVELNEKCKRRLVSQSGVSAVELTDEARARFEEAVRPAYAKTLDALVGKSLIGKIRGASEDARVTTNP